MGFIKNKKAIIAQNLVKELYEKYPYPSREILKKSDLEKYSKWVTKIFSEDASFWKGKEVLELGCGTGELANSVSLKGGKILGIDFSKNSIKKAKKTSKKFNTNAVFLESNILDLNLNKKFDVVIALGSLHHTIDAKKGFLVAIKHTKKRGILILGFYNKYSRFRHRIKRVILKLFCGNNIEKRINLGKKLFKGIDNKSWLADKFGQVHESYHSINQILKWFNEENVTFIASNPKFKTPILDEIKWLLKKQNAFFVMVGKKN